MLYNQSMSLYPNMNSSNTALLVIDVINSCAHEKCEIPKWDVHFSKIRTMIPKLVNFIEVFKESTSCRVIYTNTTPWRKEYLTENINELYSSPGAYYYSEDSTGFSEQFYLVSPSDQDLVVTKNHYDAFATKGFEEQLKNMGIRYLLVTGVFGDGCVLATICGGFSKGFNFLIIKDLIETTDSEVRQSLQTKLKEYTWPVMYGITLSSEEFLHYWKQKYSHVISNTTS